MISKNTVGHSGARLLYLYVESCRALKKQSFCLDGRYSYSFRQNELRMSRTKNALPSDFFHLVKDVLPVCGRVSNISAVVGKNGTGKTSLARALLDVLWRRGLVKGFVAVFDGLEGNPGLHVRWSLPGVDLKVFLDGALMPDSSMHNCKDEPGWTALSSLKLVYYSPVYSAESVFFDQRDGYVAHEPQCQKTNVHYGADIRRYGFRDVSMTGFISDVLRQDNHKVSELTLALKQRKDVLAFIRMLSQRVDLSDKLGIPAIAKENSLVFLLNRTRFDELVQEEVYENLIGPDPGRERLRQALPSEMPITPIKAALVCFAADYLEEDDSNGANVLWEILERLADLSDADVVKRLDDDTLPDRIPSLGVFLDRLQTFAALAQRFYDSRSLMWTVPLEQMEDELFKAYLELMEPYLESKGDNDLHSFGLRVQPSSGEMLYLTMWTRLYQAFAEMVNGIGGQKNVLLFLDEAESTLHPEWQRQLVKRLIQFWEALMPPQYSLQIILATHSPVVLSDIPSSNVTYLYGPDDDQTTKPLGTFASNLYDLLCTGFFMKGGTIGAFACSKLNHVIDKINASPKGRLDENEANLVRMVSDEILREYLKEKGGVS